MAAEHWGPCHILKNPPLSFSFSLPSPSSLYPISSPTPPASTSLPRLLSRSPRRRCRRPPQPRLPSWWRCCSTPPPVVAGTSVSGPWPCWPTSRPRMPRGLTRRRRLAPWCLNCAARSILAPVLPQSSTRARARFAARECAGRTRASRRLPAPPRLLLSRSAKHPSRGCHGHT